MATMMALRELGWPGFVQVVLFLVLLLGPLWWQRRQRQRLRLERLREADAAQEAREREGALAALLGEASPEPPNDDRIKGS